jgi:UV DNA damage endonuclease
MVDYSSQQKGKARGSHAQTIDVKNFRRFLSCMPSDNVDIMLEIKDKEESALKAVKLTKTPVCIMNK